MNQEQIQAFVTAISTLNWTCNYIRFCEILSLNPDHNYAKEQWEQFQNLTQSLNAFDIESLTKMVEAYEAN